MVKGRARRDRRAKSGTLGRKRRWIPVTDATVTEVAVADEALAGEIVAGAIVMDDAAAGAAALIAVLEGRSAFYRTLSGLYYRTLTQEQIDALSATDFSEFGADDPLLTEGFDDIRRYLRKRNTGTRQELAVDYTSAFEGTKAFKGERAVPYESVYLSETGLLNQEPRNEVYRTYKKSAVRLREGVNLPEDHLSFEFEFMAIMSGRAIDLLQGGQTDEAIKNLELQKTFLQDHILSWFKQFADRATLVLKTRFYRGVLKITEGYLALDFETLEDLIAELEV